MSLQRYGDPGLAAELLPRVGRGELVLTVAPTAAPATTRPNSPSPPAGTGTGRSADWVAGRRRADGACPGRTTPTGSPYPPTRADGRTVLALVPAHREGVALAEQISTSGERLAELRLDGVRIAGPRRSSTPTAPGSGCASCWPPGPARWHSASASGVLAMTSEYTGKREQFGFPVATFQAVAVQAADRYIDLRAMEATLWQAAWRISHREPGGALPAAGDVAVAKIWASEGVRRVVQTAQHLHGGFGADTDYPLHRYHAWAKQLELSLGPAAAHEEALGDLLAAHPLG